ncbi:MAG: L-2-hydroxyglutarate oxidase LhgO [Chloroflexota bacterium]|jgi:L-2-hydroxyglutarate oxidase|nr:L-2-hydroxyglutarate oxidase [Dehalococcoidia bacterium]MQG60739.1 L-2-hydroxyglutarate oxidase [SAR202 cluster bacterium]CAI8260866.1 MAG: L-2-hydroxyglutarate oxidase LhgO [Chloroflexota bacterium]|tara:strand:+ start:6544 stop:7755 length:1212 start_codon:yes stop_codon:yes gene_type:complete
MNSDQYDIAIIGGGIIGLSTAMHILQKRPTLKVVVVEKENTLAKHQTGNNSGVIHSGIYYKPGSWKSEFCVSGVTKIKEFCDDNEIEYVECGKTIVATSENELGRLQDLYERGQANGVPGLEMIGPERLQEIEPHVAGVQALWSPKTGIVDYVKITNRYADIFQENGGSVLLNTMVQNIDVREGEINIDTNNGTLNTKHVINCAGLYSDKVAEMMGQDIGVHIIPFRGEYYKLSSSAEHLVKGLIYPVPDPRFPFLGVHYTRNIHGYVEAGPNAVLAFQQEGYKKTDINVGELSRTFMFPGFWKMLKNNWKTGMSELYRSYNKNKFVSDLQRLIPSIDSDSLVAGGAGVRAQAVDKTGFLLDDFKIVETSNSLHVINAPSPGATSSLAIGEHLSDLAEKNFYK